MNDTKVVLAVIVSLALFSICGLLGSIYMALNGVREGLSEVLTATGVATGALAGMLASTKTKPYNDGGA